MSHPLAHTTRTHDEFVMNDMDNEDTTTGVIYIGQESLEGDWYINKIDKTDPTAITSRFASRKNNPTYKTYASAYTNRATLTYDTLFTALG